MRLGILFWLIGMVLGILFLPVSAGWAADLYKWRDTNGTLHFGAHPPVTGPYQQLTQLATPSLAVSPLVQLHPARVAPLPGDEEQAERSEQASAEQAWLQVPLVGLLSSREQAALRARGITLHPEQRVYIVVTDETY